MKVERRTQMAVHSPRQPVDHVAGPVASRKIVGLRIARQILHRFLYRLGYGLRNPFSPGPFAEPAHPLRKGRLRHGLVAVPYLVRRLLEKDPEFLAAPVADFYEHVQEATDNENRRKQANPDFHGGFPPVGVHGFRSVFGVQVQGFLLEHAVAFRQALLSGVFAHGSSQDALAADGRGHVDLFLFKPGMLLVRGEVFGDKLGRLDRGSDDAVSAEALLHAMPVHVVPAENVGQDPERRVDLPEKKRLFDVDRERRLVGHHEGRSDGVRDRIHLDSPRGHVQLFRTPNLLQPVSVPDSLGEQLGMLPDEFVQHFPELFGIFDTGHIFRLIEGENDCTIFPGS